MPKVKGIEFDFNGEVLTIPPLSLGSIEDMQDRLEKFSGDISPASVALIIDLAFVSLKRNYPGIAREEIAEKIDLGNMFEVFSCCMDVSGIKRKGIEDAKMSAVETS